MSYFAAATLDVDGAIMVTASHNPPQDNGFKFSKQGGAPVGQGTGLEIVRQLVLDGEAAKIHAPQPGKATDADLLARWCDFLKPFLWNLRKLKVVIDCGNSVMGPIARELLRRVDPQGMVDAIWLFDEPDGSFPWHPADPLKPINLQHLQGAVLATKADLGIAFDGDGDRLAFIDENARFVGCDLMLGLFAGQMLARPENRGKHVLYDLRSTRAVVAAIEDAGGVAEMSRVGHSHIKAAMRGAREGRVRDPAATGEIILAGELSGHFYFRDTFTMDSSERALLLALSILGGDPRPLSEQIAPLRRYWHSGEISYSYPDRDASDKIVQAIERSTAAGTSFKLDGLSVETADGWFNVRASNTEPVIRLTAESFRGPGELAALVARVEAVIAGFGGKRK
jgi:phosphomannomutase